MLFPDFEYQLPDLHVWLQENAKDNITSELSEHPSYAKTKYVERELNLKTFCGIMPQHNVYAVGPFGKISTIQCGASFGDFEIYCIEGGLFEGIRRYKTIEDTGKTIVSLLTTGMFPEDVPRQWDVWNDFLSPDPEGPVQDVNPPTEFFDWWENENGEEPD